MNEPMETGWCKVDLVEWTEDAKRYGIDRVQYPYRVSGINLQTNERFSWQVPAIDWIGFDLSGAMRKDIEESQCNSETF